MSDTSAAFMEEGLPDPDDDLLTEREGWQLQTLKPIHKQVCALWAQGLQNVVIARTLGITPQYVHMLMKQPLCLEYVKRMSAIAGVQLEALTQKSVDVIANAMDNGTVSEQLKGARLQLEATKRIGSANAPVAPPNGAEDRLLALSERLVNLLGGARIKTVQGNTYEAGEVVQGREGIRQLGVCSPDPSDETSSYGKGQAD